MATEKSGVRTELKGAGLQPASKACRFRYQMYQRLYEGIPRIRDLAKKAGKELGLDRLSQEVGLYPGSSGCPGNVPNYILDRVLEANGRRTWPVDKYQELLRVKIKEIFGDEYDGVVLNTCESVLRVVNDVLFSPPILGRGDPYRCRVLMPFNEDYEYLGAYGRVFPPRYKGISADRSVSAGELSVEGKVLNNLDVIFARYAGARYEVHGIRSQVVPLLANVSVQESVRQFRDIANRHGPYLTGLQSLGYDTPGYGHSLRNTRNAPLMLQETSQLAHEFGLPHFVDCGGGLPVVGYGLADIDADLMAWSMDKAGRTFAAGLLVGKEELMLPIRKACGVAGQRFGGTSSHGKALYSCADPGRDTLATVIAYLEVLQERPEKVTKPVDQFHELIESELQTFKYRELLRGIKLTKSHAFGGSELNFEDTWSDGEFGIPISTLEDYFANSNVISIANEEMGVSPATVYSGNMFLAPGLGTLDANGDLMEDEAALAAKALIRSMEIVCDVAGVGR